MITEMNNTKDFQPLSDLYKELEERRSFLEAKGKGKPPDGRILELQLVMIRIQQILLDNLK